MGKTDPRVDAYIAKSAAFARPILNHLRKTVHAACPTVEETVKWRMPFFTHQGLLCMMAAFKQHCVFRFWKEKAVLGQVSREAMGQFGRITAVSDLPSQATLARYVKTAMAINETGAPSAARAKTKAKSPPRLPADLRIALAANAKAHAGFAQLTHSRQSEYVEWLTEAKRPETRQRRLGTAVGWIAENKHLNWKYERSVRR